MGACLSLDVDEKKARVHSEQLDKYLQQCAKQDSNIVKILLLGKCRGKFCFIYEHVHPLVIV